jgi:hypothetical protein
LFKKKVKVDELFLPSGILFGLSMALGEESTGCLARQFVHKRISPKKSYCIQDYPFFTFGINEEEKKKDSNGARRAI